MKDLRFWFVGAGLIIFDLILAASGVIHFRDGEALEAAFPVPLAILLNNIVPKSAYIDAADALRHASPFDGDALIAFADAQFYSGEMPRNSLTPVEAGLRGAPASSLGWASYSEMLEQSDPKKAALALDQAFTLAPYDYFWAGARAQLAARLWSYLDNDTKNAALRQIRMLWDDALLRDQVLSLSASLSGSALLDRAYASEPDTLRAINRWLAARRQMLGKKQ